jgi:hypothetical protein
MPEPLVRGLPCLPLSPCLCVALSSVGPAGANPLPPSPRPCNSAHAPSDVCSAASTTNPKVSPLPIGQVPADPLTTTPSMLPLWPCGNNIRLGGQAISEYAWPTAIPTPPCPANVPCNAGFAASNNPQPRPGADPKRTWAERPRPTIPGRWTPVSSYAWAAARVSPGCGWWTSTVAPSWAPPFSPHYYWGHVPTTDVQRSLRAAFARWGLPRRLRVDNGKPWGSWSDLPPALALWLIGLGIELVWNDPRRPQQNGVVERSQGTGKRWAEPGACATVEQLQGRLDEDDRLQRERYPLAKGLSRWKLFPELMHTGRVYREGDEEGLWRLERVREHLAGYAVMRQVDKQGQVSVYNRNVYAGVMHSGQQVWVQYDPEEGQWLVSDSAGQQLRTKPAPEINAMAIRNLQITGPK